MPDAAARTITVTIACEAPPADDACAQFGVQDKAGTLTAGSNLGGLLEFVFAVEVVHRGDALRLRGSHVHGTVETPFAYLSCRGPGGEWRFRLKVPLAGLLEIAQAAAPNQPLALTGRVRATGGGSVPLVDGWTPTG